MRVLGYRVKDALTAQYVYVRGALQHGTVPHGVEEVRASRVPGGPPMARRVEGWKGFGYKGVIVRVSK
jgi:hypothetical protein